MAFFEALAISKEMAIEMLRRQVPGDGIVPSPRAQEFLDSGEWDAVEAVSLKRLSQSGTCVGIVGSIGASTTRFCGKTLDTCAARRHVTEVWEGYSGGWYIQAGSWSSSGFYQDPHLPLEEDGGPINRDIEEVIEDSANPFVLWAGQWKFVCEEWLASRVDTFSQLSDLEREATRQADRDDANPGTPRPINEEDGDDDPVGIPGFGRQLEVRMRHMEDAALASQTQMAEMTAALELEHLASASLREEVRQTFKLRSEATDVRYNTMIRALLARQERQTVGPGTASIQAKLDELRRHVELGALPFGRGGRPGLSRGESELLQLMDWEMHDPAGVVSTMASQLKELSSKVQTGGGVELHGVRFNAPADIGIWLKDLAGPSIVAIFHDATSILQCVGIAALTHEESLKIMKAQKDANFPSDLSARVSTSFRTVLPSALIGSGAAKSDDEEAGFNLASRLKNHDVWHAPDGLIGRSQRILKGLPSISKRVSFLANIAMARADVLRLSQGMVPTSIAFLQSLITFMSTWHLEMVPASPFTDVEVWQFSVHILETIFEKLRTTRGVIQDAAEDDPSLLIWGMLKAHEVMARLEHTTLGMTR